MLLARTGILTPVSLVLSSIPTWQHTNLDSFRETWAILIFGIGCFSILVLTFGNLPELLSIAIDWIELAAYYQSNDLSQWMT